MGIGVAFPKDSNLIEWKKYEGNPVIPGPPKGYTRTDLRDTYAWKEGNKWYMAVGFGVEKDGVEKGAVLLYTSPDLKKWDFVHTLFEGNPDVDNSGIFWEMPVFKKIGQKYVLLINKVPHNGVPARAMYWVGDFKNEKFIPDDLMPKNTGFHRDYRAWRQEFGDMEEIVVVIESDDQEKAARFGDLLYGRLAGDKKDFSEVFYPYGLPFFKKNGLLFMPLSDLQVLRDNITRAKPVLKALSAAPSVQTLFSSLTGQIDGYVGTDSRSSGSGEQLASLVFMLDKLGKGLDRFGKDGTTSFSMEEFLMQAGPEGRESSFSKAGRMQILTALPVKDGKSFVPFEKSIGRIRKELKELQMMPEFKGVKAGLTGTPVLEYEEMATSQRDITLATIMIALVGILTILARYHISSITGTPGKLDAADTAWVSISAALVMLMTPALGFFYGGLVRQKNVVSTIMQCLIIFAVSTGVWTIIGYTLAFGPTHGGWGREVRKESFRDTSVGPRAVLRIGDKIDVVFSERTTGKDRDFFKSAGIVLEEKRIIVVKSNQAHRASFDPIVAKTYNLDTPGTSTVSYLSLPFSALPRPMYPIDREMQWQA